MKPQAVHTRQRPIIEPLEQRIAPALLVTGANLLGGAGNPTTGEGSIGGNSLTLVKVLSGNAIVWYDHGAIDGISVGPNTSLDISGDVGFIVANLNANGTLTDSDSNAANGLDGDQLLANNIVGITTHPLSNELGSISNIITGGSVSNLNISGHLSGVFAGDGAFNPLSHVLIKGDINLTLGSTMDINPVQPGPQYTFNIAEANAHFLSGASVANVKVGAADAMQIFAGDGAMGAAATKSHPALPGQPGGSISNVTIESAFIGSKDVSGTPSYSLIAGQGGSGVKGGVGGSIQNINEVSASGVVNVLAGVGGNGSKGAGGAGGSIKNLNMQSDSSAYTVLAGSGGNGAPGGAGGTVKGVNFGGDQLSHGIVVAAPFTGSGLDSILLVDSQTGTMVLEANDDGRGWTPVVQDSYVSLDTIGSEGSVPVAAAAVYINGDTLPDIVVAYKGTENIGVYINQGGGHFYTVNAPGGVYSGDTLDATSITVPFAPTALAAGDFNGDGKVDLAVAMNNQGTAELIVMPGDGNGGFTVPTTTPMTLPAAPVNLIAVNIHSAAASDLIAAYKSGEIDALIATPGATNPFNVVSNAITVTGGLANVDVELPVPGFLMDDPQNGGLLVALSATGNVISIYGSTSGEGSFVLAATVQMTADPGTALVAHFVPDGASPEPIAVLSSVGSGSELDGYSPEGQTYVLTSTITTSEALKNFVPVIQGSDVDIAAAGTSIEHFALSSNGGPFNDISLPFSGKTVTIDGGNGGDGTNASVAAGGAGGMVSGFNIYAGQISIHAGDGGSSINAPAGAGGAVINTPTLLLFTGQSVPTILDADSALSVQAGFGGSATGVVHAASGGAGGVVQGLNLSMLAGNIVIDSGAGGNGSGGAGGNGGNVIATKSVDYGGDLDVTAGGGGSAAGAFGNGGAGGSIITLTHRLSPTDLTNEVGYNVSLVAGAGGSSVVGIGGAGGSVQTVNLTVQAANESVADPNANPATTHADADSTVRVVVTAGAGGNGVTGGAGGSLKTINSTSVFDQVVVLTGILATDVTTYPEINPIVAQLTAGNGGNGTRGAGGAGGSITSLTLAGISHYDPDDSDPQAGLTPLVITSGNGGNGTTTGGAGGQIIGVNSENAVFTVSGANDYYSLTELAGATVVSGSGGSGGTGAGGVGGTVSNLSIGVSGFDQVYFMNVTGNNPKTEADILSGGQLTITTGAGGNSGATGKGGAGGSIVGSVVGAADLYEDYGILLQAGPGGSGGAGGGVGGNVTSIQLNAPENVVPPGESSPDILSSLILAGNGGAATGASSVGGTGGSISQIVESKDVNTAINVLQAGNGGAAIGTGGLGGSVIGVNTVGLIGQESDNFGNQFGVFQTNAATGAFDALFPFGQVPEGVFAGRGGTGATAGVAGSVMSINAAQIAAIGAAVDANGLFAAASKVANITAQSIAYDVNGNGKYDNVTGTNTTAPDEAVAIDGFIFSDTAPTGINTLNNTLLHEFTFVA